MIFRGIIPVLFVCCCLSPAAAQEFFPSPSASPSALVHARDFGETVIPITALKVRVGAKSRIPYKPTLNPPSYVDLKDTVRADFGTGFCLDPECRFIGTNYHVAVAARPHKIKGEKVIQSYLATGPDDEGATVLEGLSATKYNLSRDLAIFELRHALAHHHGVPFDLDELQDGQEVEIYAYLKGQTSNPIRRRSLLQFHGRFKGETTTGLLAFDLSDQMIRPGVSGGIVVNTETQKIVGILSGTAKNAEAIALAVPIQSLVEFVSKVEPYLAERIFPHTKTISPVSADFYPKFVPPLADTLERRPQEPAEIKLLRSEAQLLADSMRDFIAVQTFAWGSGDKEPAAVAAYEVQVIDGYQRFREYPGGKKELQNVPLPPLNDVFAPGGEWSELPQWVGTELGLKIHQAPDAATNGRRVKVFQYEASVEDHLCTWNIGVDYGFFATSKTIDTAVYGEVWTDEDMNILRISEHCEIPDKFKWKNHWAVVTYGWLKRADKPAQLIPLTIYAQAEHKKRIYWCRGKFTNYRMFTTRVKIAGE